LPGFAAEAVADQTRKAQAAIETERTRRFIAAGIVARLVKALLVK
jgi:hypothetical protein